MSHPVSLPKATAPMDKCQIGIRATQGIPQPQERIQVRCTRLQGHMQHQGPTLIPLLVLRHSMRRQGVSLHLLLLRHSMRRQLVSLRLLLLRRTLLSRCHLSMEISLDQQAHLEPVNLHHHHRTTIKLILLLLLYFGCFR